MIKAVLLLKGILSAAEQRKAYKVLLLMLGLAALETLGVASIMPFVTVVANPEMVATNPALAFLYRVSGVDSTQQFMIVLGVASFCLVISSLMFTVLTRWAMIRFSQKSVHSIACRTLDQYLSQPYEWYLSRHTSALATTLLAEIDRVVAKCLFSTMLIIANSLVAGLLILLLLLISPGLAIGAGLALGTAYMLLFRLVKPPLRQAGERRLQANRERYRVIDETFGGIKDVKVSGLEPAMLYRFHQPSESVARHETRLQLLSQLPTYAIQGLIFGGGILVLLIMMTTYDSFATAAPVIITAAFAALRLFPCLQRIYLSQATLRSSAPALESLHADIRELAPAGAGAWVKEESKSRLPLHDRLELVDVCYRYDSSARPTLEDVSLTIRKGQRIGIVGSSGAGKTTLVDLVLGLLEPKSGWIAVDGVRLDSANTRHWQRSIGYVPQAIYLADQTIARNIAFGLPEEDIDYAAVERAARAANLHEFVTSELPSGYRTEVGERGVRLSGGQRQRIGIARALYHDPDVLILDEATSALDNQTESIVMEALSNLGQSKTVLLIAHRLSTVQECDQIVVMAKGRVVSMGTYGELLEHSPDFQSLARIA
ncbi:MAG: ABC transporter ATP-binding protein [Chromatiales bacterium]|nr:ABC transporter ATP-binding protein [Chromatiales bacterium]